MKLNELFDNGCFYPSKACMYYEYSLPKILVLLFKHIDCFNLKAYKIIKKQGFDITKALL